MHQIQRQSQTDHHRGDAGRGVAIHAQSNKDSGQHKIVLPPVLEATYHVVKRRSQKEREERKPQPDSTYHVGPEGDPEQGHRGQSGPSASDFLAKPIHIWKREQSCQGGDKFQRQERETCPEPLDRRHGGIKLHRFPARIADEEDGGLTVNNVDDIQVFLGVIAPHGQWDFCQPRETEVSRHSKHRKNQQAPAVQSKSQLRFREESSHPCGYL